ncbi:MAG: hypothetical protein AAF986_08355 [Pseudomonadota bacterium]
MAQEVWQLGGLGFTYGTEVKSEAVIDDFQSRYFVVEEGLRGDRVRGEYIVTEAVISVGVGKSIKAA